MLSWKEYGSETVLEGKPRLLWEYVGLEMPERYRCKIYNQAESASLALWSKIRGNILEFRTQILPKAREQKEPGEWMQIKSIKQRLSEPRKASVMRARAASKEDERNLTEHWGGGGGRCDTRRGKMDKRVRRD